MTLSLYDHQLSALDKLESGSILCGGVGSGKSRTALAYYYLKEGRGTLSINNKGRTSPMKNNVPLYIITTARKRDLSEWTHEACYFPGVNPIVDSWNNIGKYTDTKRAFFIFDEQRVVGSGAWAKAFIKIAKSNRWILLSATPGDTWLDYVSVFIANGFFKNRSEFMRNHVIFSRFAKYPKVERYINQSVLEKYRSKILVEMPFTKPTISHNEYVEVPYNKSVTLRVIKDRWNIFEREPIRDAGQLCLILRRIANSDYGRLDKAEEIIKKSKKIIVFYNFNYELDMLKERLDAIDIPYSEYNGHKHEQILTDSPRWCYLVQYTAGSEGWNCIETDSILFYSENYSYKIMEQASGRINRLNTPFVNLYYYHLVSKSPIDIAIQKALSTKKDFNERAFYNAL